MQTSAAPGGRVVSTIRAALSDTSPFPSDRFTVADDQNLTRRRVNLPLPSDCVVNRSDCEDVRVLNELDGFSTRPLVVIPSTETSIRPPFQATCSSLRSVIRRTSGTTRDRTALRRTMSIVRVCGDEVVSAYHGINQIVWDPATRVLHAKADRLLDEHTRHVHLS